MSEIVRRPPALVTATGRAAATDRGRLRVRVRAAHASARRWTDADDGVNAAALGAYLAAYLRVDTRGRTSTRLHRVGEIATLLAGWDIPGIAAPGDLDSGRRAAVDPARSP